jgi:hypothetical protein
MSHTYCGHIFAISWIVAASSLPAEGTMKNGHFVFSCDVADLAARCMVGTERDAESRFFTIMTDTNPGFFELDLVAERVILKNKHRTRWHLPWRR